MKEIRTEQGITQKKLAAKLKVTDRSIRDWENEGIEPDYKTLGLLAEIFNVTAGQLLGLEDY